MAKEWHSFMAAIIPHFGPCSGISPADYSAHNFAILRHVALNLLKVEQTATVIVRAKRLKARCNE